MLDEYVLTADETTAENFSILSRLESEIDERRICELYELSASLVEKLLGYRDSGMNVYELLSLLADSLDFEKIDLHSSVMTDNIVHLNKYLSTVAIVDRTVLCELFYRKLLENGVSISEADFLPSTPAPDTFIYVKNAYADEAYDVFSQDYLDPRVSYAKDFKEAVRHVMDGTVTYALLPLEEKGGNRIQTVAQLIFTSELKINSVTPVFGFDGNADMKYAIVSKHFTVPQRRVGDDRYLEIRLASDAASTFATFLTVSELFGHSLYRVSSVSFDTEDGVSPYFSVVLRDDGRDFTELLIYLTLFTDTYTAVGIYKNLE